MPKLTIQDVGKVDVPSGTRLVNALVDHGGDPLYRCGGNARCTTCRVEFVSGEPEKMTQAEMDKLGSQDNLGKFRLSCQCLVEDDMHVKVLMRFADSGLDDPGPQLIDQITT
ncbi:MAG: 2Fe-2S iron-sulfur cluster-binding protein [Chloroflexota bacterium]